MTDLVADGGAKISVVRGGSPELLVSVYSTDGCPLGKIRGLDADGKLRKASRAALTNGRVEQRRFPDLLTFLEAVGEMGAHQAIGFGACEFPSARVVTTKCLTTLSPADEQIVARTKDFFSFHPEPGVLQVDYDPPPGAAPLNPGEVVKLLRKAVPELNVVTMCSKPSSSSHLWHPDGSSLAGLNGAHIFIPVQDATLIPQFGQTIVDRLWLAGNGRMKISAAGLVTESTILDQSVLSPERLCFVRATCENGVTQSFPAFQIHPGAADELLGETCLRDLTPLTSDEHVEVARLKSAARAAAQPEADRIRKIWAEQQADRRIAMDCAPDELVDRAALVRSFLQNVGLVLPQDLVLYPLGREPVTAAVVLSEAQEWNGVQFADPFEPEYGNDPRIAKAIMDRAEPYIMSFAHGGLKYYFRSDEQRAAAMALAFADLRERRRFEAVPAGEFICGPTPRWLVRGVLPEAALGVLYGASGSGKSFLALDIAASVALGRPWNSLSTNQGDVVYICAEGAAGFRKRIEAYCTYHAVDFGSSLRVTGDQPDLLTRDDIDDLLAELQRTKPALIIIDTLAQVMPGGDENSGVDVGKVLKVCRQLHEQLGAMVLLVHHAGKDLTKGARGWSGLRAAADVEIAVAKGVMANVAQITKMKDGDDQAAYSFKLKPVELPPRDGEPVTSCVVEYCQPTKAATRAVEPKGVNQQGTLKAARELASVRQGVLPADILSLAVASMPFDPGADLASPKRDNRRNNLERALRQLCGSGVLFLKDGRIFTYDPQIDDVSLASNASNETDE